MSKTIDYYFFMISPRGRSTPPASDEVQQTFQSRTREAIDRGVFGSPWYLVDGKPFRGQDRLGFVERRLADA